MVKAVVAEDSRCNFIEEKLSRAGILSQVGLVIGKLSKSLDRGFVFDLVPTPQNEAGESASSLIEGVTKDDKNKGSKSKSQSQSSALFIDKDWVAEHARQVSRMLLGGMKVIGVYIWVSESLFKNSTLTLCQTVKGVAQATSGMDADSDDRLLIHISYSPRRWICRNCAHSSNITSSNLRPCDFKMGGKVLASLQRLKCTYNFHLRLPVFFGGGLKTRKLLDVVQIGLSSHAEVLKGAKCLVDGRLVIEDDQSVPDGLHEVEFLLPFMQDNNFEACSQKDVFGLVVFSGGLSSIAYVNPKEPLSQALNDIKEDIIRSLRSRLELMFDEADEEPEEGDKEADHHHMSSGKNLASTDPKSRILLFPRRVFVPWLEDTFISDYIQPSETIEVVKEHCLELMSLEAREDDWRIVEAECEAIGARFNRSFWDTASGDGYSSTSESNQQNLLPDSVDGKASSQASSRSLDLNIIIALLVLIISVMIGTILFLSRS